MKKYLLILVLSWLFGILLAEPILEYLPYILFGFMLLFAILGVLGKKELIALLLCLAVVVLGSCYLTLFKNRAEVLVDTTAGNRSIIGRVASEPRFEEESVQFLLETEKVDGVSHVSKIQFKIRDTDEGFRPEFGQRLAVLNAKVSRPYGSSNPGNFDYGLYLKSKGIYLVGDANRDDLLILKTSKMSMIEKLRSSVRNHLKRTSDNYLDEEAQGMVLGILLGDTFLLSENSMNYLRTSGIIHIVCVSGLHISILMLLLMSLFRMFSLRVKNIIAVLGIGIFIIIIGAKASAVRAGVMALISALAVVLYREKDTPTSLAVAALVLTLMNPYVIYNLGFILSFGTTIGLLVFANPISKALPKRIPKHLRNALSVAVAAQLASIPLLAYFNQCFYTYSILANLMIFAVMTVLFCLSLAFGLLGGLIAPLGKLLAILINPLAKYVLWVAKTCSELPYAKINLPSPTVPELITYLLLLFLLYAVLKHWKKKKLFCIICAICFFLCYNVYQETRPLDHLEATYISVGHGDASLIRTKDRKSILIDAGGAQSYDTAEYYIIPMLLSKRVLHLDAALVSHYHEDHAKGMVSLIGQYKIDRLYLPLPDGSETCLKLHQAANEQKIPITYLKRGDQYKLSEDVMMTVLWPEMFNSNKANDRSLVLDIVFGKQHFLYTGDIGTTAEKELTKLMRHQEVSVLKVSHHGSVTSTSDIFLETFRPQYAVISTGKEVQAKTLDRLLAHGVTTYNTLESGAVTFYADGQKMVEVKTFKE